MEHNRWMNTIKVYYRIMSQRHPLLQVTKAQSQKDVFFKLLHTLALGQLCWHTTLKWTLEQCQCFDEGVLCGIAPGET